MVDNDSWSTQGWNIFVWNSKVIPYESSATQNKRETRSSDARCGETLNNNDSTG